MLALAVRAAGMVTPVGFDAAASCAAMRAGIRKVDQTNLWDAESGTYLAAGKVPLPHWWVGLGKLAELVAPAIQECLRAAEPVPCQEIPVLLGVSAADRPYRFKGLETDIMGEIEHRLGFPLHPASRVVPRGHVAAVVTLREADRLIADRLAPCVVVAGVDSLIQQDLVEYYLARRRLLTPRHSNGFSVGEAGSAVLVEAAVDGRSEELRILGTGLAREEATIESEEPLKAMGLTQALRDALQESGLSIHDVQYRVTDINGEHYKFKEMALAMMRFERKPKPKLFELWHPIEFIGDPGAAIGPIVLGIALHAGRNNYGVGPTVLCTFGNDDGERAALVATYTSAGADR
jgi:3-oxoacyl-[acyl-carrier-protein] synthase-1